MDLNLSGIYFDNDTGHFETQDYKSMLVTTRSLFDYGKGILGLNLETICLGGGLPASIDMDTFVHFAAVISKIIDEFFPEPSIKVIAEPGDFLIAPSMTLFCTVQARKEVLNGDGDVEQMIYYVNYSQLYQKNVGKLEGHAIHSDTEEDSTVFKSMIMGATGDRDDIICESVNLPLQYVGDVLYFTDIAKVKNSSVYGGFRPPTVKYFLKQSCKIIL